MLPYSSNTLRCWVVFTVTRTPARFHIISWLELLKLLESWYSKILKIRSIFLVAESILICIQLIVALLSLKGFVVFVLGLYCLSKHNSGETTLDWFLSRGGPWTICASRCGLYKRFSNYLILLMALTKSFAELLLHFLWKSSKLLVVWQDFEVSDGWI